LSLPWLSKAQLDLHTRVKSLQISDKNNFQFVANRHEKGAFPGEKAPFLLTDVKV
jgi:hypothetical protein